MGSFTNYLELQLLDHVLEVGDYTSPTIYVGLCTADPTDAATGASSNEVSGGSYARVAVPEWDVAAAGATENTSTITFPTASASWGTVTFFCLYDALTGGNALLYGALDVSKTVGIGDILVFAAGAIDITLD